MNPYASVPVKVTPHRLPTDNLLYSSSEIRAHIRKSLALLSKTPYDPETEYLPIRPDAFFWAAEYLCGTGRGILYAGASNLPTVWLEREGTVGIRFVEGLRSLTIRVLAKKLVVIVQTFADGQTRVERMLDGETESDTAALEELTTWLLGDSEIPR